MLCPYESGKSVEAVRRELGLKRIFKLASNENPLGAPPRVLDTLKRADLELHTYPDNESWELRHRLADRLKVAPEQLVFGAGSATIMRLIADAYLDHGDEAEMADLSFPVYEAVTRVSGARPVIVPVDEDLDQDLEGMLAAVTPRTKVVFLATPNNPTGRVIPHADLAAFLDRLPPSVLCVLDLAYWEYTGRETAQQPLSLLRHHPNLLLLRTFSKVYGLAGLRIGYAVAHESVTGWLNRIRIPFGTSVTAELAARIALEDDEHVRRSVALNCASRELLADGAARLGLGVCPSDANFLLVNTPLDSEELFQELLLRGIIVRPMRHPRLPRCIRVTTGREEAMHALLAALEEVLGRHTLARFRSVAPPPRFPVGKTRPNRTPGHALSGLTPPSRESRSVPPSRRRVMGN